MISRLIATTTTDDEGDGQEPIAQVERSVAISRRKNPSGVERRSSDTPCSAMNIASVVISGESFTTRMRKPLISPISAADAERQNEAEHKVAVPVMRVGEEGEDDDDECRQMPTERSMPPVIRTNN